MSRSSFRMSFRLAEDEFVEHRREARCNPAQVTDIVLPLLSACLLCLFSSRSEFPFLWCSMVATTDTIVPLSPDPYCYKYK